MKERKFNGFTVSQIKAMADEVVKITLEEAKAMPGFYGRLWPTQLEMNGFVDVKQNGKKMFYELTA